MPSDAPPSEPPVAVLERLVHTQDRLEDVLRPAARHALPMVLRRATVMTQADMMPMKLTTSSPYRAEGYACDIIPKPLSKCLRPVTTFQ